MKLNEGLFDNKEKKKKEAFISLLKQDADLNEFAAKVRDWKYQYNSRNTGNVSPVFLTSVIKNALEDVPIFGKNTQGNAKLYHAKLLAEFMCKDVAKSNYDVDVIATKTAEYIYDISKERLHKRETAKYFYLGVVHEKDADYYVDNNGETTENKYDAATFLTKEEALDAAKKAVIFDNSTIGYEKVDRYLNLCESTEKLSEISHHTKSGGGPLETDDYGISEKELANQLADEKIKEYGDDWGGSTEKWKDHCSPDEIELFKRQGFGDKTGPSHFDYHHFHLAFDNLEDGRRFRNDMIKKYNMTEPTFGIKKQKFNLHNTVQGTTESGWGIVMEKAPKLNYKYILKEYVDCFGFDHGLGSEPISNELTLGYDVYDDEDPWNAGYTDYFNGVSKEDNPYEEGTGAYEMWQSGYSSGENNDNREEPPFNESTERKLSEGKPPKWKQQILNDENTLLDHFCIEDFDEIYKGFSYEDFLDEVHAVNTYGFDEKIEKLAALSLWKDLTDDYEKYYELEQHIYKDVCDEYQEKYGRKIKPQPYIKDPTDASEIFDKMALI